MDEKAGISKLSGKTFLPYSSFEKGGTKKYASDNPER